MSRPAPLRRGLLVLLMLVPGALLAWAGYAWLLERGLAAQQAEARQRLGFYARSLDALLDKYAQLPQLLTLESTLAGALATPDDPARIAAANRYLEAFRQHAQVSVAYLIAPDGVTLAASNWREPQGFVGRRFDYRPYFRDAIAGRPGRMYAFGTTSLSPGYYLSAPLRVDGRIAGVVVVKVSLGPYEAALPGGSDPLLVADDVGVVFLSSMPAWRYHTLSPLPPADRTRLAQTRQYPQQALQVLAAGQRIDASAPQPQRLRIAGPENGRDYMAQTARVGPLGWHIVLLSNTADVRRSAAAQAAALGFGLAFVTALWLFAQQRRRRLEERRESLKAQRAAHAALEARIAEQTEHLVITNEALTERIHELERTEALLRRARDNAVQTAKLAVLGQMAAGVTHELNQPLAALTTLSDNAARLLELNETAEARENLGLISQLAQRMGRIVGQLKTFARKESARLEPVLLADAFANALMLVEPRRRELNARIDTDVSDETVRADALQLEQVLVNLLRNGLDAMEGQIAPVLAVGVRALDGQVEIRIRDHGDGIAPEALARLFEPFYTTKPVGKGLGLGLAISHTIVQSFSGSLAAENAADGGALFILTLPTP
ncbi:sensor histidine kinase [Jeongeupia chitinilytica]|uniref:histidine kinase n=1 Tax=Jeongeupia chitinilytica TaxID=1041641 RepID=A0ABQ3H387_9NEIS|nr:ATP-binding protein [Jeongeupia chitinilytica]GHD64233.1 two-component sensor histidine kinase [Jeongeupia chitinilytica]